MGIPNSIFRALKAIPIPLYLLLVTSALAQGPADVPRLLNSNGYSDSANDVNPQLSTDKAGTWLAVWHSFEDLNGTVGSDSDIFFARSLDSGKTWSSPHALNSNAGTDTGSDELPRVTTDLEGNWVAVWYSRENLQGLASSDLDILFSRSGDNGKTWSAPALLNSNGNTDSGDDGWPVVQTDRTGKWIAMWWSADGVLGQANIDSDIFVSTSTDNGKTWSPRKSLVSGGDGDFGFASEPRFTTDYNGNWVAVWRCNYDRDDRDIAVVTSKDNGLSWTEPALLNSNGHSDSGDDAYPCVTTDGAGNWVVVWRSSEDLNGTAGTDRDIFVSTSTDNGANWTPPSLLNTNGNSDTGKDQIPQIITDQRGHWMTVWSSNENLNGEAGNDGDIFMATSTDNGISWTPPSLLNVNGADDTVDDFVPQIATDEKGTWLAIWDSENDTDKNTGKDFDIFVTVMKNSTHP